MISWYAVYTQPHAEAKAHENLRQQGYSVYLPRYGRWVRHARKRQAVLRPLFPRYLFVGLNREAMPWRPVLSTVGVTNVVCGGDEPIAVPPGIIETLRRREREGAFNELTPTRRLKPGDRVRIIEGPFEDLVGRLLAAGDDERVFILLDLLGRTVKAQVSAAAVEAA